jgi:hypothetical protein
VADGPYTSMEAAVEAAVVALQEESKPPTVPDEHMELVEEAIAAADSGQLRGLIAGDWSRLRKLAHDVAARSISGGR